MKKLLLLLALSLSVVGCGCCKAQVGGSSTFTQCEGKTIKGLTLSGGWDAEVTQGNSTKAIITIPTRYKDYFKYEVVNGIFKISRVIEGDIRTTPGEKMHVELTVNSLEKLDLSGGVDVHLNGDFVAKTLVVGTSGGTDLKGEGTIRCQDANLSYSGGADVSLNVNATGDVYVDASGGADIELRVSAENSKFSVSGGVDFELDLNTKNSTFSVSGAGNLTIQGQADYATYIVSGGADISATSFINKGVSIEASGAADVNVNATDYLKVRKSGAASIGYKGNPRLDLQNDGVRRID